MKTTVNEYQKMVKAASPKSKKLKDCIGAFFIGGFICALGEVLYIAFSEFGLENKDARGVASVMIILFTAILTGLGVFDKIAKRGGAGTLVPISGFANATVSPAIEYKTEGLILGLGANIFKIAGPVILYGVAASVIYGIIYWIFFMI